MKDLISKCLIAGSLVVGLGVIACENTSRNSGENNSTENAVDDSPNQPVVVEGNDYSSDSAGVTHTNTATGHDMNAGSDRSTGSGQTNTMNSNQNSSKNNMSSPTDSSGGNMSRERNGTNDTTYTGKPNYPR